MSKLYADAITPNEIEVAREDMGRPLEAGEEPYIGGALFKASPTKPNGQKTESGRCNPLFEFDKNPTPSP